MAWSLNSRCYPRSKQAAAAAAARSMSWMVTQRRCFVYDAQPAIGASLRRQTTVGWRGLGPRDEGKRTRRAPLRTRRLYSSSSSSSSTQSVNARMLRCVKIQNTKTGPLERTRHVAARPEAASVALDAWVPTPSAARLFAAPDHNNSSWSRRLLKYLHVRFSNNVAEKSIGP